MEGFLNFVINYYVLFLAISIFLIFALIGYFVDVKRRNDATYQSGSNADISLEELGSQDESFGDNTNRSIGLQDTYLDSSLKNNTVNQFVEASLNGNTLKEQISNQAGVVSNGNVINNQVNSAGNVNVANNSNINQGGASSIQNGNNVS